jgi:hypothetical protein
MAFPVWDGLQIQDVADVDSGGGGRKIRPTSFDVDVGIASKG